MARSTSVLVTTPGSRAESNRLYVSIPLEWNQHGTVAQRAERATRWLWARGVYPSPSAVNARMRGKTRDCLNGIETKARNKVMRELGIPYQRQKTYLVEMNRAPEERRP